MRVLVVSQVYAPEMGAAANRLSPMVRELLRAGHEVSVATGMPNYPQGVVHPEYQGKRSVCEERDGARVPLEIDPGAVLGFARCAAAEFGVAAGRTETFDGKLAKADAPKGKKS